MLLTKNKFFRSEGFPAAHRCCDSLFDDSWRSFDWHTPARFGKLPQVDIEENDDAYFISVNLPGMSEEDLDLTVADNTLNITAGQQEEERSNRHYVLRERHALGFQRKFSLPSSIDVDAIAASFKKGVLEITVPKKEEVKPRKIELT